MRPPSSAARAAAIAVAGAGAAGCPTSMCTTRPPAASMRAAAAITSITMKAGTALRGEGVSSRFAVSNIVSRPLMLRGNLAPLSPHFCDQLGSTIPQHSVVIVTALTVSGGTTRLRGEMVQADPNQADMTGTQRPIRALRTTPAARVIAMLTASALVVASVPAQAQRGPAVVRDAEIEQLLKEYTQPLLKTAGLAQQNVQPVIINDRAFNAFVADGRRIFVNAGALMDSNTPNEIIGVLAHETGHIAGGHLARLREQLANASTQSILAMILGVGALVAAGRSNANSGIGQAGAAENHGEDRLRAGV